MVSNPRGSQEGTDPQTITVELTQGDAQLLAGIVAGEQNRAQNADDPTERESASIYARLHDHLINELPGGA